MLSPPSILQSQPATLLDLFLNPIVHDNLARYLSLQTVFRLIRLSRSYQHIIQNTPSCFRLVNISHCQGAYTPLIAPIDAGGHSWRAERMDENLTEDEFYAGPLRYVLSRLSRLNVLRFIHVLVLDGLNSVTVDLLHELLTEDRYDLRLLSVRKCRNVNQVRLQQLLRYICRPSRREGTPRLQGLYVFGDPANDTDRGVSKEDAQGSITAVDGAALGTLPTAKARLCNVGSDAWYETSGSVLKMKRSSWEETLLACQGIIAFDAILCSTMHEAMASGLHEASVDILASKPGVPPIATIALGNSGCASCGRIPPNVPIWGQSEIHAFPLLSPPLSSGKLKDAVRPPAGHSFLLVSCSWCLANRHCDSCHRWWCVDCYNPKRNHAVANLQDLSDNLVWNHTPAVEGHGDVRDEHSVKVFSGLCIEHCLVGEMMAGAGSNGMWG